MAIRALPEQGQPVFEMGDDCTTIPTIDSNVGTVEYKNMSFIVQMRNEDHLLLERGPVRILGGTWTG